MVEDGGAGLPVLTLVPTEEPPPKRKRARRKGGAFDPTEDEKLSLRTVLNRLQDIHAGYGWTTSTGKPRHFNVVGGMCRVALACLRDGWTSGRLVEGLRAICWRDARATGEGLMADRRRNGDYATLRGMLGHGQRLMPEKSGNLDEALRQFEDAGRPEAAPVVSTSAPSKGGGAFVPRGRYS